MLTIGLTGGSGSGKGEVAALFSEAGVPTLDTDAVYHGLVDHDTPCLRELCEAFGEDILKPDGGLSRQKLASIVFAPVEGQKDKAKLLGKITHKYVKDACFLWLQEQRKAGTAWVLLDVPLLFESGMNAICDVTVAVIADKAIREARICTRDDLTREAARERLAAQPDNEFYTARADFVIYNNGTLSALRKQTEELIQTIKKGWENHDV